MKKLLRRKVLQQAIEVEGQNKRNQEALIAILQRLQTHLANPGCIDEALIATIEEDVQKAEVKV